VGAAGLQATHAEGPSKLQIPRPVPKKLQDQAPTRQPPNRVRADLSLELLGTDRGGVRLGLPGPFIGRGVARDGRWPGSNRVAIQAVRRIATGKFSSRCGMATVAGRSGSLRPSRASIWSSVRDSPHPHRGPSPRSTPSPRAATDPPSAVSGSAREQGASRPGPAGVMYLAATARLTVVSWFDRLRHPPSSSASTGPALLENPACRRTISSRSA
jgi:hypothetical protein